jgi:hypothetical protein
MFKPFQYLSVGCVLMMAAMVFPARAQHAASAQTLFLYVKVQHDSLILEKSRLVRGTLKSRRPAARGDLWYEISSSANQPLNGAWIRKPTALHYDVLRPDGSLSGGVKTLEETTFVIRVPYSADLKKISFYKPAKSKGLGKAGGETAAKGECVASFPIVLEGGAQ